MHTYFIKACSSFILTHNDCGYKGGVHKNTKLPKGDGLDNFGFRYYDYELGRFLTRDPSGYSDGPNNYLYCSNDPVNKIDPLGLKAKDKVEWHHLIGDDKRVKKLFKKRGWSSEEFKKLRNRFGVFIKKSVHRGKKVGLHPKGWNKSVHKVLETIKEGDFNQKNIVKAIDKLKETEKYKRHFDFAVDVGDISYKIWHSQKFKNAGGRHAAERLIASLEKANKLGNIKAVNKIKCIRILNPKTASGFFSFFQKIGRKLPLVKWGLVPVIASSVYNKAKAEGASNFDASGRAIIEAANPFPIGFEDLNDIGNWYGDIIDQNRKNAAQGIGRGLVNKYNKALYDAGLPRK